MEIQFFVSVTIQSRSVAKRSMNESLEYGTQYYRCNSFSGQYIFGATEALLGLECEKKRESSGKFNKFTAPECSKYKILALKKRSQEYDLKTMHCKYG